MKFWGFWNAQFRGALQQQIQDASRLLVVFEGRRKDVEAFGPVIEPCRIESKELRIYVV